MPRSGPETIRRSAAFALAVQLTTAGFTAVLTVFLVRALGPEEYGMFALALAIGFALGVPADLGITQATSRFLAERRDDPGAMAAVLGDALRLKLLVSGAISIGLFLLAGPIADAYDHPEVAWPIRAVAIALLAQTMMLLFGGAFIATRHIATNFRVVLSESAVETGASIALVLAGAGASGAAFGRAIGYAFGAGLALALALRLFGRGVVRRRAERDSHMRRIAGYAGALAIVDGAYTLFEQIDAILIGAFLGATAVGHFQAPMRLIAFLHYPGLAAANAVAPRLARREGEPVDAEAFALTLRLLIVVQAALCAPVLVWSDGITHLLLGADYDDSADVLRALTPYVFLAGLAPLVSLAANYLGVARRRVPIALTALAVNFAIDLALIPKIGIIAGAIGTDVAFVIYVAGHAWLCRDVLALELRPLAATGARALAAFGAAALVLLAFGTDDLTVTDWLVGGPLAIAAFAAVILVSREPAIRDLRTLARRG